MFVLDVFFLLLLIIDMGPELPSARQKSNAVLSIDGAASNDAKGTKTDLSIHCKIVINLL